LGRRDRPPTPCAAVRPHAGSRLRPRGRGRFDVVTATSETSVTRPLVSADNHVFEPVTLWQERLPAQFRDRGPRLERRGGWFLMAIEGMPDRKMTRANDGNNAASGTATRAGGADADQRLRDMALDGVVAEVIYPTFGLFIDMMPAADLQMACAQVYN